MLKVNDVIVGSSGVASIKMSNILNHSDILDDCELSVIISLNEDMSESTEIIPERIENNEGNAFTKSKKNVVLGSVINKYDDITMYVPINTRGIFYSKILIRTNGSIFESNQFIINNNPNEVATVFASTITKDYNIEYVGLKITSEKINESNLEIKTYVESGGKTEEFTAEFNKRCLYKLKNPSNTVKIKITVKKLGPSMIKIYRLNVITN